MKQTFTSVFCLLASLIVAIRGETFTIDPWEKPSDGQPYDSFTALEGDTIIWYYGTAGTNQDVWIHLTNTCDRDPNDERVKGNNGPGTYTFTNKDGSDIGAKFFFACNTAGSCQAGQYVQVTVFNTEEERQAYLTDNPDYVDSPPASDRTPAPAGSSGGSTTSAPTAAPAGSSDPASSVSLSLMAAVPAFVLSFFL